MILVPVLALLTAGDVSAMSAPETPATPQAIRVAAAESTSAPAAPVGKAEQVCRTRFVVGQGLVNSMKTRKVCRTRTQWKAAGVDVD